jgi:hypothetical protein
VVAKARRSRLDRGLQILQRNGVRRGVMGGSRPWFWVAIGTWGLRRLRRTIGSEPEVVYRGELQPGQTFRIDHLTETYGGKTVKVRRRSR